LQYWAFVARTADPLIKRDVLDQVVRYLADHGIGQLSLRPMALALSMSPHRLLHHLGPKDEMVGLALMRAIAIQEDVRDAWFIEQPNISQTELLRLWWAWLSGDQANLNLVRLGLEAAALDATVTGLAREVRAKQVGVWRIEIEERLILNGLSPQDAEIEASIVKAVFTGLVIDLMASGDTVRLTAALDRYLDELEQRLPVGAVRPASVGVESVDEGSVHECL
jgi:AcrR family transcriptional regulator